MLNLKNKLISHFLLLMSGFIFANVVYAKKPQILCVFDIGGKFGSNYNFAREYALQAQKFGVTLELKVSNNDTAVYNQFINKQCDAAMISGFRVRSINSFTGSTDTFGAVTSEAASKSLLNLLNSNAFASKMATPNGYEVVGITPLGAYYLFLNDRNINNVAKLTGKRWGVMEYDESQARIATRVGAIPVSGSVLTIANKFNNGEADIIPLVAMAYEPLGLEKGLKNKGSVMQFPLGYANSNIIIHKSAFPANYGQKSRAWVNGQLPSLFNAIAKEEVKIPAKYWMTVPFNDRDSYLKLMKETRMSLTKQGFYDAGMMSLAKKIRCNTKPLMAECSVKDE